MSEYSAEEVREWKGIAESNANLYTKMTGAHEPWTKLAGMLADLLERIKADEGADGNDPITEYYEDRNRNRSQGGFTHPRNAETKPAQAAQLWEMKQRACRAHALCNELRLAHPEIPELGDDGALHEAIHDILRVDTPTAAPAAQKDRSDALEQAEEDAALDGDSEPVAHGEVTIDAKYDNVLVPFARLMAKELHANAGKGDRPGWLSMTPAVGMLEIYYHAAKLQKSVKDGNGDGIREYAADVANMAMMLLDVCGGLEVSEQTPPAQPAEREVVGHKTFHTAERGFWHEPLFADEAQALWASVEANDAQRVKVMPDEESAIRLMFEAGRRLKDFGWNDAIYCPKDRSKFLALEFGSTGKHPCIYEGEFPSGSWWIVSDGDMSPSRPVLWKPIATTQQADR